MKNQTLVFICEKHKRETVHIAHCRNFWHTNPRGDENTPCDSVFFAFGASLLTAQEIITGGKQ